LRDPALAVELARQAVRLRPRASNWQLGLGAALFRAGDARAAVPVLNEGVRLSDGGDAYDHFFLALAHHQLGNGPEARKWYDRGMRWMKENPERIAPDLRPLQAEAAAAGDTCNPRASSCRVHPRRDRSR